MGDRRRRLLREGANRQPDRAARAKADHLPHQTDRRAAARRNRRPPSPTDKDHDLAPEI
jgi:hypothetical protein